MGGPVLYGSKQCCGFEIRDGKHSDPGSGMENIRILDGRKRSKRGGRRKKGTYLNRDISEPRLTM